MFASILKGAVPLSDAEWYKMQSLWISPNCSDNTEHIETSVRRACQVKTSTQIVIIDTDLYRAREYLRNNEYNLLYSDDLALSE